MDVINWFDAEGTSEAHKARDEIESLRKDTARYHVVIKQAIECLEYYKRQDERNAMHYPPEYAKDLLPILRECLKEN